MLSKRAINVIIKHCYYRYFAG